MAYDIIEVENISFLVNNQMILDDLSFKVKEGDSLGVYGPTGSGKSVLLNLLRGTKGYKPSKGKIYYNISYCPRCKDIYSPSFTGLRCTKCNEQYIYEKIDFWNDLFFFNLIKKRTAIMFQKTFSLFGQKSVLENMYEAFLDSHFSQKEINSKIIEILQKVNLVHRATHIARDLSGGEKQRLVLARQLAIDPIVLFADEPTATLDLGTSKIIEDSLNNIFKNEGKSLIISSQKAKIIKNATYSTLLIDNGKLKGKILSKDLISGSDPKSTEKDDLSPIQVGDNIIVLDNVKKYYYSISRGVIKAVDNISLSINQREIFGIVGKSGSGKTTISKIIGGLIPFKEGEFKLRIGDEWINMKKDGANGKIRAVPYIGILHQEYSLYANKTVLENLTDSIGIKLPKEISKKKSVSVLEALGFEKEKILELLYKKPDSLSEGERHTIALAQVLVKEPSIVILDEPAGTKEITKAIKNARELLDETFIIVTHDPDFIVDVCDRSCLLLEGNIVEIGSSEYIKQKMISSEIDKIKREKTDLSESLKSESVDLDTTERQDSGY